MDKDVVLDQTLHIRYDGAKIDLNGHELTLNQGMTILTEADGKTVATAAEGETLKEGAVIQVGPSSTLTVTDSSEEQTGAITGGHRRTSFDGAYGSGVEVNGGTFTMTGGQIRNNEGGGIRTTGNVTLTNVKITDNFTSYFGGGVLAEDSSFVTMNNVAIKDNYSRTEGGGIYVSAGTVNLTDSTITANESLTSGSGLYAGRSANITLKNTAIYDNMYGTDVNLGKSGSAKPTFKVDGKVTLYEEEDSHRVQTGWVYDWDDNAEGTSFSTTDNLTIFLDQGFRSTWESEPHTPGKPVEENRVEPQVGVTGSYDEVVYCEVCHEPISRDTHTIPALPEPPAPVLPDDGGDDETEINHPLVPLASGPITRAQFIDYLWRHEGEPASDGVRTFTDVPEDHEYVLALAWTEHNGVAAAYDDGAFEPDELVTVSAVREFLGNFETVFSKQAVAAASLKSLTGADDEAVVNCDEVLTEFFGE